MKPIRLAIVGCGAVTELSHLPTIKENDAVELVLLVDKNIDRAEKLAEMFSVPNISSDYQDVSKYADACILAIPHNLHAPMSIELLKRGVHVLVEKPMALSLDECKAMTFEEEKSAATLSVGQVRRFFHSHQLVKKLLTDGSLGKIESFDVREGNIYGWPVASDFFFRKESGGGVLADTGSHTLDSILWWLGEYESFEYFDDNMGGVEANCEIHLNMKNGAKGVVELSRTRKLRNTAIIRCEKGVLELQTVGPKISIQPFDNSTDTQVIAIQNSIMELDKKQTVADLMASQLDNWIETIQKKHPPLVSGKDANRSIALIEACYKERKSIDMPWLRPILLKQEIINNLKGKRILVTGGTGFIGGRLVEYLVRECNAEVVVLVRNLARLPRIARFNIQIMHGDVTNLKAVRKAMEGCEFVFHCAFGNDGTSDKQKGVTINGTENVLKAALECDVKRVVHVSTVSVYGQTENGDLDESTLRKYSNETYADSKHEAEVLALNYFKEHGLPVSVIQPTIVYGPGYGNWTINPIIQLKKGRVIIVNEGNGLCNTVYIDDVIQAMILSAVKDEAIGHIFLISDGEPVTWREFYGAYENVLGIKSTISLSFEEIKKYRKIGKNKKQIISQMIKNSTSINGWSGLIQDPSKLDYIPLITKTLLKKSVKNSSKPILLLTDSQVVFFKTRSQVRIDKAKSQLNYNPKFNFEEGMAITERWLDYANLI